MQAITLRIQHDGQWHPATPYRSARDLSLEPGEVVALVRTPPDDTRYRVVGGDRVRLLDWTATPRPPWWTIRPEPGWACALLTDDLRGLAGHVDRVAVVHAGHVVEVGDAWQVTGNPRHPLTRRLARGARSPAHATVPHVGCPYVTSCEMGDDVCQRWLPELRTVADRAVACHYAELAS